MENYDSEFVIACFEDATNTLIALLPGGFSTALAQSHTEIVRDFVEAYGYQDVRNRLPVPAAQKITAMDEIFKWLAFIPHQQKTLRRVVALRSYTHRLNGKPKSWRSIGNIVGANHVAVKQWHANAVAIIVGALNRGTPTASLKGYPERVSSSSASSFID
jgi:hypothetical protein